jgi:hypothetical protein
MATEKMIRYALALLSKNGYSTKYMGSEFKKLGATCGERSGMVSDWLKDFGTCKRVIDQLKD